MLPGINRIKKKKDFGVVFKNRGSFKTDLFILKVSKNNSSAIRFGFVVSQKVSKKATVRNKIKRRLSDAAASEMENLKNGVDLVLIALPGLDRKNFSEVKKAVHAAMVGAKVIKTEK